MADTRKQSLADRVAERGWALVPWAHHPHEVKAAMRAIGLRPVAKGCVSNSQRFFIGIADTPLDGRVQYHEGWASCDGHAFEHAWLILDGAVLDLTLGDAKYLESNSYTRIEVLEMTNREGAYTWVNADALRALRLQGVGRGDLVRAKKKHGKTTLGMALGMKKKRVQVQPTNKGKIEGYYPRDLEVVFKGGRRG